MKGGIAPSSALASDKPIEKLIKMPWADILRRSGYVYIKMFQKTGTSGLSKINTVKYAKWKKKDVKYVCTKKNAL